MTKSTHIETIAVHAGRRPDPATGAVMPPIHLSTTFERQADGSYTDGYVYSRSENPNRRALEETLAALEGGAAALAFGSGMAATTALLQALAPGDHVVMPDDVYFGTGRLVREVLGQWGLQFSVVDMTDLAAVRSAMRPNTRLVWVETPSNPLLKITDITAVAELAHTAGALLAVDNTWPSPIGQRPFEHGADVVMHATTKYLGGHSDLLGGALILRERGPLLDRIRTVQTLGGAVPSPFDCWLLLRSIRTLPYRVRAHSANAQQVVEFLAGHPEVAAVHYPGLTTHPGHAIAARQMQLFGGMLSIQVHGGAAAAMTVAANVQLFTRATSLGGIESLIEHRASVEGPHTTTPADLLRISVGLEHPDDLIADLRVALAAIQ
ncbi:MAG: aminotransferase class I/II-fold pyridoxal phosphate-dependent enzyme [Caldilineaceae bacterium]|nr:aminotransferase class I/II-fold pyridoxal phosphate-dependent enzyme [Caldilineaceae bacterium]